MEPLRATRSTVKTAPLSGRLPEKATNARLSTGGFQGDRGPRVMPTETERPNSWGQLLAAMVRIEESQATGRLNICLRDRDIYSFHFQQGQLFWASGGNHPYRRWKRHLARHCRAGDWTLPVAGDRPRPTDYYHYLQELVCEERLSRQQAEAAIAAIASEVIVDLMLEARRLTGVGQLELTWMWLASSLAVPGRTLVASDGRSLEQRFIAAYQKLQQWQQAGLAEYSPNLALRVCYPRELRARTQPDTYRNLVALLANRPTLRDLAAQMNLDLLRVTRLLLPFISQGTLALETVGDLRPPAPTLPTAPRRSPSAAPRIVCVDDSVQTCERIGSIVRATGCRYVSFQDPVVALTQLAALKPDLIFLDLVMPQLGGYELCARLRQMSQFRTTPIVIVTSVDGLFDRMRVKVMGATDFISKPIASDRVLSALRAHLSEWVGLTSS